MAAERRDKDINGKQYSLLLPSPKMAMKLCNKAVTVLAPLIGGLSAQIETGGLQVLSMMLRGVDSELLDEIFLRAVEISKLSCQGHVLSNLAEFEQHFDENRKDLYPACIWALWECVSDFLPDMTDLTSKMQNIMKAASQFQKDGQKTTGLDDQSGADSAPTGTSLTGA